MNLFLVVSVCAIVLSIQVNLAMSASSKKIPINRRINKFKPRGRPKRCFGVLCSATSSYPTSYVKKLLKQRTDLPKLSETIIEPTASGRSDGIVVPQLRSLDVQETNLCETKHVTVFPKVAYDVDVVQRFVVNVKEHRQLVSFETCLTKQCYGNQFIFNYKTFCKQLYNNVQLLYVTEKGTLAYGHFTVPSTCVCMYSKMLS